MLPPTVSESLLSKNRNRCCVCRNPANAVEIYPINNQRSQNRVEELAVLCLDCHALTLEAISQHGRDFVADELLRCKQIWEQECESWRNNSQFSLRIKQGSLIKDVSCDGIKVGSYLCLPKKGLLIDIRSDELISLELIRTYRNRNFYYSAKGYEFRFTFISWKEAMCGLFILKESANKTTVELRSPALHVAVLGQPKDTALLREEPSEPIAELLPWDLLPPGEHPFPRILEHCKHLQASDAKFRDATERLELLKSLAPSKTYKGLDNFTKYVVFYFENLGIAVLESPAIGYAIYILKGDWKTLSRLSKAELLREHKEEVTRIIHAGSWFKRVKKIIDRETTYARERRRIL